MRLTPGVELKDFFSSESARMDGTRNLAGIASPVVDAMVDKVLEAGTREELVTATHALDRVLRSGHYWIPHWYKASHTLAYWNKFSRPSVKPKYARGVPETWWYDAEKAAKLAAALALRLVRLGRSPVLGVGHNTRGRCRGQSETRTARLIGWDSTS